MKSDRGNDCEQGGNQQRDELREFKWRLGLCRGYGMQRRDFFKRLYDQHEQIEVETNHGADDVDPAPRPCEMLRVTREDSKCEERQRYDAETYGRRETMKRKEESCDRRSDGCDEKPFRPAVETLTGKQSEYNNKAGENRDQANQCVSDGVDMQYHGLPITSISMCYVTSCFGTPRFAPRRHPARTSGCLLNQN